MLVSQQSKTIRNGKRKEQKFFTSTISYRPNQVWVSDIITFKFSDKYYYLCAIIDLFSRKIISYRISQSSSMQLLGRLIRKGNQKQNSCFTVTGGRSIFPIRLCVYYRHWELSNLFPEPGDPTITLFQKHSFPFLKRRNYIAGITNLE